MKTNIIFKSFDNDVQDVVEGLNIFPPIENIEVGYDGGRLKLIINNLEVFSNYFAGNDCVVRMEFNK